MLAVGVGRTGIKIHRISMGEDRLLVFHYNRELSPQYVDQLCAVVAVRFRGRSVSRKLGVVSDDLGSAD